MSVRAQILVEVYRNIDCANCRQPDDGLEQFVQQYNAQNPTKPITIVYFHTDFPSPVDPFYLASQTDVSSRFYDLYQQSSTPVAAVDGFVAGTTLSNWKTTINLASQRPIPGTVTVTAADTNGMITVTMIVSGSGGKQVRPSVMLLESNIIYNNTKSYGTPASWGNIFRAMIPAKNGGDPFVLSGTNTFTYKYDATGKGFNESNLSVVAFLQDVAPQASPNASSYLTEGFTMAPVVQNSSVEPTPATASALGIAMPNPAHGSVSIPFSLTSPAQVRITVSDELGREVATIANGVFGEGNNSAVFSPADPRPGMYVVTMTVNGAFVGSKKIILR